MDTKEEDFTYDPSNVEDEDVYFEKSQVHLYMQDAKFTGPYEVFGDRGLGLDSSSVLPPKRPNALLSRFLYKTDEQPRGDQVAEILLCGLMIEEHHQYLENLYVGHQRAQFLLKETICPMKVLIWCSGVFCAAASSVLYCLNKGGTSMHLLPMVVPITTLAGWKECQRQKRLRESKCTSQLIAALDRLFLTLRKSVKLVQENEVISQGRLLARGGVVSKLYSRPPDYATKLQLMPCLRGAIFENTKDAIEVLFQTDKQMAGAVPLSDVAVDDSGVKVIYEEILTEDRFSLTTIKELQNVFVLCQSEVMLRLALSLCPSFWQNPQPSQLDGLYHTISLATDELKRLETNLNLEYQIFYSFGVKPERGSETTPISAAPSFKLIDVFTGVHTAVLRLQAMLFDTRAVEKSIESYHCLDDEHQDQMFLEHVENSLHQMTSQIDLLLTCFKVALVEVNKLKRRPEPAEPVAMPTFSGEPSGPAAPVEPDEYVVEDEVYELYCEKNDDQENEREHETAAMSNDKKAEKEVGEQSATMVKELKIVLKGKAEEWKIREAIALRKRVDPEGRGTIQDEEQESQSDDELQESPSKGKETRTFPVPPFGEEIISSERWIDENAAMKISWAITENALRFRLPVSQVDEEFCCSGDESEEEDDAVE